jgi:hypothetical protein
MPSTLSQHHCPFLFLDYTVKIQGADEISRENLEHLRMVLVQTAEIPLSPVNLGIILVVHGFIVILCQFIFEFSHLSDLSKCKKFEICALDWYFSGHSYCQSAFYYLTKMQFFRDCCLFCKIPFGSTYELVNVMSLCVHIVVTYVHWLWGVAFILSFYLPLC